VKIALIADTHLAASAPALETNCRAALAWAETIAADLIVHLGDITADGVEEAEHYDAARAVLAGAVVPMRLIPGNHDIGDNPTPGLDHGHALVRPERLALYRQTFGPDWWAVEQGGWTLIGLNAQLFALGDQEEAAQFAWLANALTQARGPVGLFLHKPLFRNGLDDQELHPRYVPIEARRRLWDMLATRDLRFVVNGHTHQLRKLSVGGVEHVWAPSCAFTVPDAMQEWIGEKVVGTMSLKLEPDRHQFEFHIPPGVAQHDLAAFTEVFPKLKQRSVMAVLVPATHTHKAPETD
jgi:3',5'-cyclic AMP phosphodiesterase CpdA